MTAHTSPSLNPTRDAGERVNPSASRPAVRITGTSFLLPGNQEWRALSSRYALEFGEFGDWPQALLQDSADQPVVWVLFLEDVVNDAALRAGGAMSDDFDELLSPLVAALDQRLSRAAAPVVVAWSVFPSGSAIEAARSTPLWDRLAQHWAALLGQRVGRFPALHALPLDRFFARAGHDNCFDERVFYSTRCRLSPRGLGVLAAQLGAVLERFRSPAKKVLVLDCDNTLWGGVVGEAGLEGILLDQDGQGQAFSDFQRGAAALAGSGVLIALASKNEEADVWRVFESHHGMVLRRSDIVAHRINWAPKPGNLIEMADELGLGLDSFVLWDDNPFERDMVRAQLPEVLVPEVPEDVVRWPKFLADMPAFHRFEITAEDKKKASQYQARARFESERRVELDENAFLSGLQLKPEALPIDHGSLARAAQLVAKTNQFNLRLERQTALEIQGLVARDRNVGFLVRLKDRFGDHGSVALVMAEETPRRDTAFLNTFLLSCRVLGRHLEAWALSHCASLLAGKGYHYLVAEFRLAERNSIASKFLAEHGFVNVDENAELRGIAAAATTQRPADGELYAADLRTLKIPNLGVYDGTQTY